MLWLYFWPMGDSCASFLVILLLWQILAVIYVKILNSNVQKEEGDTLENDQIESSENSPLLRDHGMIQFDDEYLILFIPFSLYFSWVSCATLVSFFITFLPIVETDPFDTISYALCGILFLMILAIIFVIFQNDYVFGIVMIWALMGISQGGQLKSYPGKEANWIYYTCISAVSIISMILILSIALKVKLKYFNRSNGIPE